MNVYIHKPVNYSDMQGPAPSGFHVPLATEWLAIYNSYTGLGLSGDTNFSTYLKLPPAGSRNYSNLSISNRGSSGFYWSSSPNGADYAFYLSFFRGSIVPQNNYYRSNGYPIRCFKNSPVVPTASWTKLYGTSIESGGIFHNATDGLISISSDGTNWITIDDKNLGATTVYNYGDALTEANCGKIYQRGNNYGFSGDANYDVSQISQSSTQVNVTGYGPGNYYNSSTWIKVNPRQSSANDGKNLRGGVTGLGGENELKNAYIGEYVGIECDFTTGDNGFTFASRSNTHISNGRNQNGLYGLIESGYIAGCSWKVPSTIYSKGNVKKIELTVSRTAGTALGTGVATGVDTYTFRFIWNNLQAKWNATATSTSTTGTTANTEYTFTVDLVNKNMEFSNSSTKLIIPDAQITNFFTDWNAGNVNISMLLDGTSGSAYGYIKNAKFYF